jgi:hypothetical protein
LKRMISITQKLVDADNAFVELVSGDQMVDTAALIKRIVLYYDDVLAGLVAERGPRDGTYIKMRRERNALNELWQRVKAGEE